MAGDASDRRLRGLSLDADAASIRRAKLGEAPATSPRAGRKPRRKPARSVTASTAGVKTGRWHKLGASGRLEPGTTLTKAELEGTNYKAYQDRRKTVPKACREYEITCWRLKPAGGEVVVISLDEAYGPVPTSLDEPDEWIKLVGPAHRGSYENQQTADLMVPELFTALFGGEWNPNRAGDWDQKSHTLEQVITSAWSDQARVQTRPDLYTVDLIGDRVIVGEAKRTAPGEEERTDFSHRQLYLQYLRAKALHPGATVTPVFVQYLPTGDVLIVEWVYPNNGLPGAHIRKITRVTFT